MTGFFTALCSPLRNKTVVFSLLLFCTLSVSAKPLPTKPLNDAMELIAGAGQTGTSGVPLHVQKQVRKELAKGYALLNKHLKAGTPIELPAGCTFGYGKIDDGEGLVTKCDKLHENFQLYIVPGDEAVMAALKQCKEGCTGKFALMRQPNPKLGKDTYIVGPYARYLMIWLRPISVEPAP